MEQQTRPDTPLATARAYAARRWSVIPVPHGTKGPKMRNWQQLRITVESAHEHFSDQPQNIGVLLGDASGNLLDVDVDWPGYDALIDAFLPETSAVFGRGHTPRAHRLYYTDAPFKRKVFTDPTAESDAVIVEIRGDGHQTIFPGSRHESGDAIEWASNGDPVQIALPRLITAASKAAAAMLLAKHYPAGGGRHDALLALAGGLVHLGWSAEEVRAFVLNVARAAGDEEAAARANSALSTCEKAARGAETTGWPTLAEHVGVKIADTAREWLSTTGDQPTGKQTESQRLLGLCDAMTLFHTPMGDCYARCIERGSAQILALGKGGPFKEHLALRYYELTGKTASDRALSDTATICRARAAQQQPAVDVYTRVGALGDKIYLDLNNPSGEAVELDAQGWRVVTSPPVYFRRTRGMLPLPTPVPGGTLEELRGFANVKSDADFILAVAWLVMVFHPTGPYPLLAISGEQGSAKTSLTRYLRTIVDPSATPTRANPRDEETLAIAAQNARIVAIDNMSYVSDTLSDALCRLSTGGGIGKRKLYTDDEEKLFFGKAPIILNGIPEITTRGDLADRAVAVTLAPIEEARRKTEREVDRLFAEAHPHILGVLCDGVSAAIKGLPSVDLDGHPRMADFAEWATAAESGLQWAPGAFMDAYSENRVRAIDVVLDSSPIATVLRRLMDGGTAREGHIMPRHDVWKGPAEELRTALNIAATEEETRNKAWPKHANMLSGNIRRISAALRSHGLDIQFQANVAHGDKRRREIWITRTESSRYDASLARYDQRGSGYDAEAVDRITHTTSQSGENGAIGSRRYDGCDHLPHSLPHLSTESKSGGGGDVDVCIDVAKTSYPSYPSYPAKAPSGASETVVLPLSARAWSASDFKIKEMSK